MKPTDFVIATQPINGIVKNSVGKINSICEKGVQVDFIGKNEVIMVLSVSLSVVNVDETGNEYSKKICTTCCVNNISKNYKQE